MKLVALIIAGGVIAYVAHQDTIPFAQRWFLLRPWFPFAGGAS